MAKEQAILIQKFETYKDQTLYPNLGDSNRQFIKRLSLHYHFTFQELRQISEIARDFEMWQAPDLYEFWKRLENEAPQSLIGPERKHFLLKELFRQAGEIKGAPKFYPAVPYDPPKRESLRITKEDSNKNVFGNCPVASSKTVCCNLKTIDAVENCAFGCSYCTIQTFYGSRVVFDARLKEKLKNIQLDPGRFYHIGTGQSSDSLVWGNRDGILDDLNHFAGEHANILLEFKTKSDNVSYFLDHDVPHNIVCSWSLNTDTIVRNEEHFTASLARRLEAARKVADRGIKVAFHFHPIVYYDGWKEEYRDLVGRVQKMFQVDEVLFISLGSVTFIKPVIQKIRKRGGASKILQMDLVPDPHGKLTYPDPIKLELFGTMYEAFKPWHGRVYMYLCMERAYFWDQVFGWHYPANEEFELDFGAQTMCKINQNAERRKARFGELPPLRVTS